MKTLLKIQGFMPYIFILFLNATTDLAHKITIQNVLLKSFDGDILIILTAVVNAMILLPFILLFSSSGFISDKFSKTKVIRWAAFSSIFLTLLITLAYYQGWFYTAFAMTLLLATQSAIYSPAKYGMIKEMVGVDDLGKANGIVQAVTIVAILFSSIIFSIIFEAFYHVDAAQTPATILENLAPLGWILVLLTVMETLLAFRLPLLKASNAAGKFMLIPFIKGNYLKENLKRVYSNQNIWRSIIGLSAFWGVGQLMVAAFPAHYKMMTADDDAVVIQLVLAVSAIGIVIGSLIAGKLSDHHIELGIVPLGGFGVAFSLAMFSMASEAQTMGLASFLFGVFGGLLIVPLNANIQFFAKDNELGIMMAGNNFIQNIVMVLFLMASIALVKIEMSTIEMFTFAAIMMTIASIYGMITMPHLFIRMIMIPILKFRSKVKVQGIENLPQSGGVMLLGNHISWIDWMMIQVASPRAIKFVMDRGIYNKWYLNWFLRQFDLIPISSGASREAFSMIKERLDNGEVVALFPEGLISYNGQINSFKKGFEKSLEDTSHPIVPFYTRGLWGSSFSRATTHFKGISKIGRKRDIVIAFGKSMATNSTAQEVRAKVLELSYQTWDSYLSQLKPMQYHWLDKAKSDRRKRAIVDSTGADINNAKMITGVVLFASKLKKLLKSQDNIGVLLPASTAGSIVNMALFVMGKKPVNLNYTLSQEVMSAALAKAEIQTVITSSKFIKKLTAKGFDFETVLEGKTLFAEDLAQNFSKLDKVKALLQAYLAPQWFIKLLHFKKVSLDETATILFSSGSEGTPKGIELTHHNILANIKQISDLLNIQKEDVILNSLPIFHSFGLTATTLFPLCEGVPMVSIPDPTDAAMVGKMTFKYQATLMFGTSTFFRLYTKNRKLHPLMLASLRMAIAGAENLKPEIRDAFKAKFNVDLFEGYGATETAPVVSVNMPNALALDNLKEITGTKEGSAGRAIPGTVVKIVDPQTLKELPLGEDGLIVIAGPQVMQGYFKDEEKTAEVICEIEGIRYYKSGDKGHLDEDGFIFIVDRYSRFAKVAGEMISLGSVEAQLSEIFGEDLELIAVNVPDEKKGEMVVLLFKGEMDEKSVEMTVKASDMIALMMPSQYIKVEALPLLGTGKADFKGAKAMALELLA